MNRFAFYIKMDFEKRKLKNPRFSMRSYARLLGVSPATLSLFLSGKRMLSVRAKQKMLSKIKVEAGSDLLQSHLLEEAFTPLDLNQMSVIGDWYYFAILSLFETEGAQSDAKWIAERLGLRVNVVRKALKTLLSLDMLNFKNGLYVLTGKSFETPDMIASMGVRRSHEQALDLARKSLQSDPVDKRKFVAVTMAIDPDKIPEVYRKMQKFIDRTMRMLESGKKKEVYRMACQLFPLSRETGISK